MVFVICFLSLHFRKIIKESKLKEYNNLYNKARHSYIYPPPGWPNSWTEWAENVCGHSGVA